jgi:hypothetical protein
MSSPALRIDGGRKLRAELKRAGVDVQDLKDAHRAVADLVKDRAAPAAPRRTGRLAGDMRAAGQQGGAVVSVGRKSVPYAGPIHWGWPSRHIRANPWIWEAAQDTEEQWTTQYLRAIEAIVNSIETDVT